MSEIRKRMMSDERAHGECVGMNHAEDEIARLQAENDVLTQRLAAVESSERDCQQRIARYDREFAQLQAEHARMREQVEELESKNCFTRGTFAELYALRDQAKSLQQQLAAAQEP